MDQEKKLYIVRCGEVALKGMNKPYFERVLIERVRSALKCYDGAEARWIDGLMFVRVPAGGLRYFVISPAPTGAILQCPGIRSVFWSISRC